MKFPCWFIAWRLLIGAVILSVFTILPVCQPVAAQTSGHIQELQGVIEGGRGVVYTLRGLKKGGTLYAYMANTGGNLDPMLGILKNSRDLDSLQSALAAIVENSDLNLVNALSRFVDDHFTVWDDDSGTGYDAFLKFSIPADGTYYVFAASTITNQKIDAFAPHLTSGSYRLMLGLNAPGVETGEGEPTSAIIARIEKNAKSPSQVQHLDLTLSSDKRFTFQRLIDLQPGDSLYARLVSTNGHPLPRIFLSDFGGKPLAMGDIDPSADAVTFTYHSREAAVGLVFNIDGGNVDYSLSAGNYRLTVGIDTPAVLTDSPASTGLPVIRPSNQVNIALSVDQIVSVDQQNENFTLVGSLELMWQDIDLAYSPDKCRCTIKAVEIDDLISLAAEKNIFLPVVTFFNQQGNRWSQNQDVFIEPSGLATYRERFTVTLQAPDFDFQMYPFDRQQFHVRIDLDVPTEAFIFEAAGPPSDRIGDQLGEEQWTVVRVSQDITEIPLDKNLKKSRFTMTLDMERHLNFYLFRIFMPIFLIIGVSWVIFFLKDYGRQLEVASGNLLVFVAFNFTISDDVPRLGNLTLLDRLIITSFVCAALVVFISVCQKRLEARGKKALAARIDTWVLLLYPFMYVLLVSFEYFSATR